MFLWASSRLRVLRNLPQRGTTVHLLLCSFARFQSAGILANAECAAYYVDVHNTRAQIPSWDGVRRTGVRNESFAVSADIPQFATK
jgi:hypothetical protein